MKKEDYRIILKYSQLTLNSLTAPYYHVNKGCQFNIFELDKQIQAALQQDESKQFRCPVCKIVGQLKPDIIYCQNQLQNENNQFVVDNQKEQAFKMKKISYTYSQLSQQQDILDLQKAYNSKILQIDQKQNQLTIESIEKLNQNRNNEIIQFYCQNCPERNPSLVGVINFKLVLFYHLDKVKLEFDLYDNTDQQNCIKIHDHNTDKIIIRQVSLIKNYIYLIIQQENLFQLYRGLLNQIFKKNQTDAIFYVEQMPGYTLYGESRLIQFQDYSLMIGKKSSIIVKDDIDQNVVLNQNIKIPNLKKNSQVNLINDSQILFTDYDQQKCQGLFKEFNFSGSKITENWDSPQFNFNYDVDFSLFHNNLLYLLSSQKLNQQKAQVYQIMPGRGDFSFSKQMNIINHQSYLKVKIIPTIISKIFNVSCALVGLAFQKSQTVFPAVLVLNDIDNLIEIELI